MKKMLTGLAVAAIGIAFTTTLVVAAPGGKTTGPQIGINVVLDGPITRNRVNALESFGSVVDRIEVLNALTMRAREADLDAIRSLPFVMAANPDAERDAGPVAVAAADGFGADGINSWNLDAINVTDFDDGRTIDFDGAGVYVAVLDTGLLNSWRYYFPAERIATEYARSFGGGGANRGHVSEQPNKWEQDQDSHGTHVTSTILGYRMPTRTVNGVAPMATVIPVKVLNQDGSGWSSMIARGIVYVADLKEGPLNGHPVVINMSLGGSRLDAIEQVAIDYAIGKGVIIVASAGNRGTRGMGYPGAYEPVISVAASGFTQQWTRDFWWRTLDVPEPTSPEDMYIAGFSSRAKDGQDLDVTAPGAGVVGPYQIDGGHLSWYYLSGTSMASPHVAGIVALMAQKNGHLTAAQAETILESATTPLYAGCREGVARTTTPVCWDDDATGAGLITADAAIEATPTPP